MMKGKDIGVSIVAIVLGIFGGIALAILLSYLVRHKRGIELFFEKVRKGKMESKNISYRGKRRKDI